MRPTRSIRTVAAVLFFVIPRPAHASPCDATRIQRVLFIGNSFTYVNNMPHLVEAIAAGLPGPCVATEMIAIGGATLQAHWAADSAARRIRDGHWTAVVIQDQSTFGAAWSLEGVPRVGTGYTELTEFANRFVKEIQSAGARPVVLAHWSDVDAPARDDQALEYAFAETARATGSAFAPLGAAIRRMRKEMPEETPYFDGHHLSQAGSYLEALVLYATLTDRSPKGAARHIEGPAVEFNRGIVYRDSIVTLVDVPARVADTLQAIAEALRAELHGKVPVVTRPPALEAEFPKVDDSGDALDRSSLEGRWVGTSKVLPTPGNQPLAVELVLHSNASAGGVSDSLYLHIPQIEFSGAVTLRIEGSQAIIQGSVIPHSRVGRAGPPEPFTIELRGVLHAGVLSGIARMHQGGNPLMPSFDGVGRFEVRRGPG